MQYNKKNVFNHAGKCVFFGVKSNFRIRIHLARKRDFAPKTITFWPIVLKANISFNHLS